MQNETALVTWCVTKITVRPWLATIQPAFIVDSDPARHGERLDGIGIRAPAALAAPCTAQVLVASYRYEHEILGALAALGVARVRVLTLRELMSPEGAP